MAASSPSKSQAHDGEMVWLDGGQFMMGSDDHYPEEAPRHPVRVDGFWIDRSPVTNRDFAAFVEFAAVGEVVTFVETVAVCRVRLTAPIVVP